MINQEIIDNSNEVIIKSLATETGQLVEPIPLLKFRPLDSAENFERLMKIIETGKLWCSKVSELNDPMEGAFSLNLSNDPKQAAQDYQQSFGKYRDIKNNVSSQVICSLSAPDTLYKHLVWSHYAGGFRGVAIEISLQDAMLMNFYPVLYNSYSSINNWQNGNKANYDVIRRKHHHWDYENEVRFISEINTNEGWNLGIKITGIYIALSVFDDSHRNATISPSWRQYYWRVWHLLPLLEQKRIPIFAVNIPHMQDIVLENWGSTHNDLLTVLADQLDLPN